MANKPRSENDSSVLMDDLSRRDKREGELDPPLSSVSAGLAAFARNGSYFSGQGGPPKAVAIRCCICSGVRSSRWVAIDQWCPNGSTTLA